MTTQKYLLPLENTNLGISGAVIQKFVDIFSKKIMYKVWYEKAKIYVRINDLDQAKFSLEKTFESIESIYFITINHNKDKEIYLNFIALLKNDEEFSKFKNDNWFVELVNRPYKG